MTGAGFLPVCVHNKELLFLFGLESPSESSAKGWSDFAGGMDSNENSASEKDVYKAALREMAEETSGFLGGTKEIDKLVKNNGGYLKYSHKNGDSIYHTHLFRLDYDEKLIEYYNANHKYLYDKIDHKLLQSTKVFEKIKIEWFTIDMMIKNITKFRHFYIDLIHHLIKNEKSIKSFIEKTMKKNNKTMKKRMK